MISLVVRSYARRIRSNLTIVIGKYGRYINSSSFCGTAWRDVEVEIIQAGLAGPNRFVDQQGISAVFVRVSGGAGDRSNSMKDIIASDDVSNGMAKVEASRSTSLSAQVVCPWIVISKNNIVFEGELTVHAVISRAVDVKGGWGVRDDRIVRHQSCCAVAEVERDSV